MINHNKIMRLIANHKGYKFVNLNDNPHGAVVKGPHIAVVDGNGETIGNGWNEDDALRFLPQWVQDDGDALKLLAGFVNWDIRCKHGFYKCTINPNTDIEKSSREAMTTLRYAVCDAYLNNYEINEDWAT